MSLLKEFKDFATKGSVVDLSIGVIIGGAFSSLVTAFTNDIVKPILDIFGTAENDLGWVIPLPGGSTGIAIGSFISAIINFLITAFIIFMIMKGLNAFNKKMEDISLGKIDQISKKFKKGSKEEKEEVPAEPTVKVCPYCLSEIAYKATRCPHCTSELQVLENTSRK